MRIHVLEGVAVETTQFPGYCMFSPARADSLPDEPATAAEAEELASKP